MTALTFEPKDIIRIETMSAAVTGNSGGNPFIARSYAAKSPEDMAAVYDEWAATFDADMSLDGQDYVAPERAAAAVFKALASSPNVGRELQVLDAGCGTGLQGVKLFQHPAATAVKLNVDGVDVSPGMLNVARKTGLYRSLETVDLTKAMKVENGKYDVVICVGTLTYGHVGPEVLSEFARVVRPQGIIVSTVVDGIWETQGYKEEVERLRQEGVVDVLSTEEEDYRRKPGVRARMVVLRVL